MLYSINIGDIFDHWTETRFIGGTWYASDAPDLGSIHVLTQKLQSCMF